MNKKNILLISIDSLRADAVSAIGPKESTTPFFDNLADTSTLFTSAFSQGIWTVPSHASIFTGLYPSEHNLYDEHAVSAGDVSLGDHPTLGQRLRDHGYETSAFYRLGWLSGAGILRGFKSETNNRSSGEKEFINSLDSILSTIPIGRAFARAIYRGSFAGHMPDKKIVTRAADAINSASSPFCFFVHLNDAHWPYSPSRPFHSQFSDRSILSLFWNRAYTQTQLFPLQSDVPTLSKTQVDVMKELYLGAVRQVDHHLMSLINKIPDDTLDETIIIIFGDHGEAFGENDELGHNAPIPEVTHVPLLIRDPTGSLPVGSVDDAVQLADIYQTVGSLAGISLPDTNTSDLTAYDPARPAFTHAEQNNNTDILCGKYAVWKSHRDYIIWDAVHDTTYKRGDISGLREPLDNHLDRLDPVSPTSASALTDDTKQQLSELGYLTE
jgi:arylsulfatase A-like enzyme